MPWHFVFESLAYAVAFRVYTWHRSKAGDFLDRSTRLSIIAAAISGAVAGSKLLFLLEDPARTALHLKDPAYYFGGKTVVGGLLGGTIAVEWLKHHLGIQRRTGDLFAIPLALGIAIGRIGCFLAGVNDDTHGIPTSMIWGVDLGDGVKRHPVQLYESFAMLSLIPILHRISQPRYQEGDRFRGFLFAYLSWRFCVDFLKPVVQFGGLSSIQWACLAGLIWYTPDFLRFLKSSQTYKGIVTNG